MYGNTDMRDYSGGFSVQDMEAFSAMVNGTDQDDNQHMFGSALNPGSLHSGHEKKEIAKPMAQIAVKTNNRAVGGGAIITEEQKQEEAEAKKKDGKDIFTEDEINIAAEVRPDDRP